MELQEFHRVLEEVIPAGVKPQTRAEWVHICEALELPIGGTVSELIESVYTEKGMMLYALRTGRGPEKKREMTEGAEGGVSILKNLLTVITESNVNTHAMLERSVGIEEKRHQLELERLKKQIQQSEKVYKLQYKPGILKMPNFNESEDDLENYRKNI
jgi:hypothetical protein